MFDSEGIIFPLKIIYCTPTDTILLKKKMEKNTFDKMLFFHYLISSLINFSFEIDIPNSE